MRYEVKTNLEWEEVKEKALSFFEAGLGLEETEDSENCLNFKGGGGYVYITSCVEEEGGRKVELETREWDRKVKSFMKKI